jgi:hypothetical protein
MAENRKAIDNLKDFSAFWWRAVRQAFNFSWLAFGVISNVLPTAIATLQHRLPSFTAIPWMKWVSNNQAEIQIGFFCLSLLLYLVYAPYRLYQKDTRGLSSEVASLKEHSQRLVKGYEAERATMSSQIKALNEAADDEAKKHFDIAVKRTVLGQFLLDFQEQLTGLKNMFYYEYREEAEAKAQENRKVLMQKVVDFLDKEFGRNVAAKFMGARVAPVRLEDDVIAMFAERARQRAAMINDLEARHDTLLDISETITGK